jgi:SAM-dependent methyltransferase
MMYDHLTQVFVMVPITTWVLILIAIVAVATAMLFVPPHDIGEDFMTSAPHEPPARPHPGTPATAQLGEMHAASFATDPKHLGFVLARYKFIARMLQGKGRVLEVGCGDTTGARLVKPSVGHLIGIDRERYASEPCIDVFRYDMLDGVYGGGFDAIYALDVLEHVKPQNEDRFLANIKASLIFDGVLIIGTPSLESQPYASALSREHHVNCKTEDELRTTLWRHFHNVFMFGQQDEVIHTGFGPMCHYRLAICT